MAEHVVYEEPNKCQCLQGVNLLLREAVISHFLSSSAPRESPLISSGLGLITSTERSGNTARMLCFLEEAQSLEVALKCPFD